MKKMFLIALLLMVCSCNAPAKKIELQSATNESNSDVVFNVVFSNGLQIDGIHLRYQLLGKRWMLQLKLLTGMGFPTSEPNVDIIAVSTDEFVELLDVMLTDISSRNQGDLDVIQVDLRLVSEVWNESVLAVQKAAKSNKGLVMHKDKTTGDALSVSIEQSELIEKTCALLEEHSYKCDDIPIGTNPIAFQLPYQKKGWDNIVTATDAGIHEASWFAIRIAD